jgi:hypothetical protein
MRCDSLEIRLKNHQVLYSAASPQRPLDFNVAAVRLNLALYGTSFMDMGIFGARFFSLSSLAKNPGPARQQNTVQGVKLMQATK